MNAAPTMLVASIKLAMKAAVQRTDAEYKSTIVEIDREMGEVFQREDYAAQVAAKRRFDAVMHDWASARAKAAREAVSAAPLNRAQRRGARWELDAYCAKLGRQVLDLLRGNTADEWQQVFTETGRYDETVDALWADLLAEALED